MSNNNDWRTPPELFKKLDDYFAFQTDVCASDDNALVQNFYTEELSALDDKKWAEEGEYVYLNPPYSPYITQALFIIEAWNQLVHYGVRTVALIPVSTGSRWWADSVLPYASRIMFLTGRVSFYHPIFDKPLAGNRHDSCLLFFEDESFFKNQGRPEVSFWDWKNRQLNL